MTTYSSRLRLALQATGENDSTWGDVANNGVFKLLDDSIAGTSSVSVTVGDATLTTNNGANDQARAMIIDVTGAPGAARNVIVPSTSKVYLAVDNTTGGRIITIKTLAGTGVALTAATATWVYCDGTDVLDASKATFATTAGNATTADDAQLLDGIDSLAFGQLALANTWTKAQTSSRFDLAADLSGTNIVVDASKSNTFKIELLGNYNLNAPSGMVDGQTISIAITQGAGGPYTLAFNSVFGWQEKTAPTVTATVGAVDYLAAEYMPGYVVGKDWFGNLMKNMG